MGQIANELAKKHNLKSAIEYQKAKEELNAIFDKKLITPISATSPTVDFSNKTRSTNVNHQAELIYPVFEKLDDDYAAYIQQEFCTHPQVNGLLNATASVRGSHLVVTTPINEAQRVERHEQTLLPNVLQVSWQKYVLNLNRSIAEANRETESERTAELSALDFLKS